MYISTIPLNLYSVTELQRKVFIISSQLILLSTSWVVAGICSKVLDRRCCWSPCADHIRPVLLLQSELPSALSISIISHGPPLGDPYIDSF
ncbi:hypothetical protein RRG08_040846 [Elysia crispata]|uniref:Uncharacterized protein n=1 Tax=Elysia crispata TaxID=231223 RepID=A0AAE1EAV3_9GAST|nr:hypothetical protein RRG08_040846 [Elysia crispata]